MEGKFHCAMMTAKKRGVLVMPLRPGDLVDIVAPASRCSADDLSRGLRMLRSWGLRVRVPAGMFSGRQTLFASPDPVRARQLTRALLARDSKAVWCVRGGYGALRLLPALEKLKRPRNKKLLIGFSDITSIHLFLNQKWGWPTVHGPMVERMGRREVTAQELFAVRQMVFSAGGEGVQMFPGLRPLNKAARRKGLVKGVVRGGNLAVLQSSLGTPFSLKAPGSILFLEDIGEKPHRVDRMLMQMRQAGVFARVRAIVFGYFQLSEASESQILWREVIPDFAAAMNVPVFSGLPVGHSAQLQMPLALGTQGELHTGPKGLLIVEDPDDARP
jgi:muramoyltetrapeptide carboxypeptidase